MSVGLDLSGTQFRSLRRQGNRLIARACRPVYAVILDNPARRALFEEQRVPFAEFGSNLILFGDAADEWSVRLRISTIPLAINGRLQIDDRVVRRVMVALVGGLLPAPNVPGDDCCLTLPAGLSGTHSEAVEFLVQTVRNLGYQPRIASSSLAVALAELSPVGVSGLGVYLGESRSEFSIVRQGRELARIEIARGLCVDAALHIAAMISDDATAPGADDLLREIFAAAAFELNRRPEWKALIPPIPLAIAGELSVVSGWDQVIASCVHRATWPFAISRVIIPDDFPWTVSRGCLIQAELESMTALARPAA
jgi:hypothetical protein